MFGELRCAGSILIRETLLTTCHKPTVKFYGSPSQREITVLERQNTHLPLRLTGDGVSASLRTIAPLLTCYLVALDSELQTHGISQFRAHGKAQLAER